jgi:C-terminal processing protease CtpA/Prc
MTDQIDCASLEWRGIYHAVWTDVQKNFFDRNALKQWSEWEHCQDEEIHDYQSTRACIDKMLKSLGDRYTYLFSDQDVERANAKDTAQEILVTSEDLGDGIGYLGIQSFGQFDIVDQVKAKLKKIAHLNGFIINLSGNTGGFANATVNCLELFIESGAVINVDEQTPEGLSRIRVLFTPDTFIRQARVGDGSEQIVEAHRHNALIAGKPIVLLVDENTMSSAELFAAALLQNGRNGQVIAIGARTHGKGIGQGTYTYEHGITVKISSLRFYSGDGVWLGDCGRTQANGIEPTHQFSDFKPAIQFAFGCLIEKTMPSWLLKVPCRAARLKINRFRNRAFKGMTAFRSALSRGAA